MANRVQKPFAAVTWIAPALGVLVALSSVGACGDGDEDGGGGASTVSSGGTGTAGSGGSGGTGTAGSGGSGSFAWVSIAGGGDHACGVGSDGRVYCWGSNDTGQLGNGSTQPSNTPVQVPGLTSVVRVAAGWTHTCAVTDDGAAHCWGGNDLQQLGDGSSDSSADPVAVSGVHDALDITCGDGHSCAIRAGGTVWCWGTNFDGQLGNGNYDVDSPVPVQASGVTGAVSVSAGFSHSCAATTAGAVWCWGDNFASQLGTGTSDSYSDVPIEVTGVTGVVQVASGDGHNCAVTNSGGAWCWGEGTYGQLGDGLTDDDPNPKQVTGPTDVESVAGSIDHSCAAGGGSVWCWGRNANDSAVINGKLGTGTQIEVNATAALVSGPDRAVEVTTGDQFSCAADDAGQLWCWGEGDDGELGNGANTGSEQPVTVSSPR